MRKTAKKIISLVAIATLFGSTLAMTACGKGTYKGEALEGYKSEGQVVSNGGFAVEKGEYIEFKSGKRIPKWYSDGLTKTKTAEERRTWRSKTFPGFAKAIAEQWSEVLTK